MESTFSPIENAKDKKKSDIIVPIQRLRTYVPIRYIPSLSMIRLGSILHSKIIIIFTELLQLFTAIAF